jgi:hypothetical protein
MDLNGDSCVDVLLYNAVLPNIDTDKVTINKSESCMLETVSSLATSYLVCCVFIVIFLTLAP